MWPFVGSLQLMTCAVPASIVKWNECDGRKRDAGKGAEERSRIWSFTWRGMCETGLMGYLRVPVRDERTTRSKGTPDQSIHTSARTPLVTLGGSTTFYAPC